MASRRNFLVGLGSIALGGAAGATELAALEETPQQRSGSTASRPGQAALRKPSRLLPTLTRARYPRVLVNHVGFRPDAGKFVVVDGIPGAKRFEILNLHQRGFAPSFTSELTAAGSDLGEYLMGDFSAFTRPGTYKVCVYGSYPFATDGQTRVCSHAIRIAPDVWDEPIRKLVNYYRVQSCGASKNGFNAPCHVGKIPRDDGGEAKPITGGWHSAEDFVRDVPDTLHGMFGLLSLARARVDLEEALGLFEEVRWGNDYFLSIQSPQGYLYFGVYAKSYYDATQDWWDTAAYVLITEPATLYCQYKFIAIQALTALQYQKRAPAYAARCLEAGKRCFEHVRKQEGGDWGKEKLSYELGTGLLAAVHLFRATGDTQCSTYARELARQLTSLQAADGFFAERHALDLPNAPEYNLLLARTLYGPFVPLGLCAAARWLSDDPDRSRWTAALEKFAGSYVQHFSAANAFGILPYRIYRGSPPHHARSWKELRYRYFMETNYQLKIPNTAPFVWQTGSTASVAGFGVVMVYLAEILGIPWLRRLAQRHLASSSAQPGRRRRRSWGAKPPRASAPSRSASTPPGPASTTTRTSTTREGPASGSATSS